MDKSPTLQESVGRKIYQTKSSNNNNNNNKEQKSNFQQQAQRKKLVRSTESFGNAFSIAPQTQLEADFEAATTAATEAATEAANVNADKSGVETATVECPEYERNVMGGGFAIPPPATATAAATTTTAIIEQQPQETTTKEAAATNTTSKTTTTQTERNDSVEASERLTEQQQRVQSSQPDEGTLKQLQQQQLQQEQHQHQQQRGSGQYQLEQQQQQQQQQQISFNHQAESLKDRLVQQQEQQGPIKELQSALKEKQLKQQQQQQQQQHPKQPSKQLQQPLTEEQLKQQQPAHNSLQQAPREHGTQQRHQQQQMHEKLLDSAAECGKEKTDKLKKLLKTKDTAKATTPTTPTKSAANAAKPPKETHSKFAEKLRRSFRRGEHKSLEIKRPERSYELSATHSPQEGSSGGHFGLKSLPPLHRHSPSIFSLSNLPGLGSASVNATGGHINPALLLDSPDEGTPPEYAYQHLSSVATTNSSTSLESSFGDFGERTSSQSSISYWAWQQSSSSMGGEVSTTSSSGAGGGASVSRDVAAGLGSGDSREAAARDNKTTKQQQKQHKQKLETQSSSKSDTQQQQLQQPVGVSHTAASRSCSITSDSSSTKLTRLQNFLFKSSNESSKSFQGHSNEAFTASSHNSSSGEWENLGANATNTTTTTSGSGSQAPADFYVGSFPEESEDFGGHCPAPAGGSVDAGEAGNYYQYTLTSPNNPFLPEIIARTYHSTYDEEDELDANVTAVKYGVSGGAHSTQLPTPAYSRAGSQESTHSESAVLQHSASAQHSHSPSPSPASSSSSTPGRQKRKLFSLNSPTRHLLHQQHTHQQQQQHKQQQQQQQKQQQTVSTSAAGSSVATVTAKSTSASGGFVHSLNPFLAGVASGSAAKRAPLKQSAVTSPIAVPQDLNAKREEFLRATMKICLVVSPPTSKLQLKSKSLTHLDGLDSVIACHHGAAAGKPPTMSYVSALSQTLAILPLPLLSLSQPLSANKQQQTPNPAEISCHSTHYTTVTSHHAATPATQLSQSRQTQRPRPPPPPPPTICTQSLNQFTHKPDPMAATKAKTSPVAPLSPTKFTNSNHNNNNRNNHNHNNNQPKSTILSSSSCSSITTNNPSTTNTNISCCNSKICCLSGSASIVGVALNSTHTVSHQFQSGNGATSDAADAAHLQHLQQQHHQQQQQQQHQQQQLHTLNAANLSVVSSGCSGGGGVAIASTSASASTSAANLHAAAPPTTMGVVPASHKKKTSFMQRKKPLLTRSEVSSSEYFSVSFCIEQGCQEEEFIAATKGVTLSAALSQALKRRNLSFSQIAITDNNPPTNFLEAGYSPLASSLDENTDVENLAGRHLVIVERDGSRKTLQKAASFGSRARPPRLLSSASTEETTDQAVPGKQLKQRWSGIFGNKNAQQSQLCELLNGYAKNGVPQKSSTLHFDHPALEAALEYLDNMHKSWKDFVNSESMNDNEMRIQTAIWELVTTEVYYIHALQTVTDLFLACLEAVQAERLLTDVDQHRLFSNVRDICEANLKFWTLYLYPMVAHSVASSEPLRIGFFQQGFVAFATIFAPYKKYCAEQSTCQFYCKELNRTNALFTSYLAWCESQKMCNRLRLADILVRPMQRLTKYGLLLAAIKKHMSDVEEVEAVDSMIHTVENFVFSVNNHLTTRQENERLKGVMARIESYDVVDTSNEQLEKMIKQYSQMFDLCAPMKGCATHHVRHLFMEGDHKFKDNLGKADVHCFLLTDMLLVCKAIAKRGLGSLKVIRQPYLTDRLIVQQTNNILNCVYLNEFQVAITAFTLQCSEAKNWCESLKRARQIYTRLKQGASNWDNFRFGGSSTSGVAAESLGVKKSPMNSSLCSHVSSANNSHSGSVEWNDSRNISVDFEKTNSLSSDEGSMGKNLTAVAPLKLKINPTSANTLSVQPLNHLGQSLPNLNLNHSHTNLYHTYSNNTLLVPGTAASHSGNLLLSPSHRGISYPPPSPTRVPLRRGMAFSTSTKNPPLVKTRNITSQNSINLQQTPITAATATAPTTSSAPSQETSPSNSATARATGGGHSPTTAPVTQPTFATVSSNLGAADATPESTAAEVPATIQLSNHNLTGSSCQLQQHSNETDV